MTMDNAQNRNARKTRTGVVVGDRSDKTVVVEVERRVRHDLYGKVMRRVKKYHVHDEENRAHVGNRVRIVETRPISRLKRWRLVDVLAAETPPEPSESTAQR